MHNRKPEKFVRPEDGLYHGLIGNPRITGADAERRIDAFRGQVLNEAADLLQEHGAAEILISLLRQRVQQST